MNNILALQKLKTPIGPLSAKASSCTSSFITCCKAR
jgi:hypothetical protein